MYVCVLFVKYMIAFIFFKKNTDNANCGLCIQLFEKLVRVTYLTKFTSIKQILQNFLKLQCRAYFLLTCIMKLLTISLFFKYPKHFGKQCQISKY